MSTIEKILIFSNCFVTLAYMKGRTLASSFVILDEAQNTTLDQMKMFLTRTCFSSKFVVRHPLVQKIIKAYEVFNQET